MDWYQIITIVLSIVITLLTLFGVMFHFMNKIDQDIRTQGTRLDSAMSRMDARMCESSSEITRLYHMFVDLLRDNNKEKKERKVKK